MWQLGCITAVWSLWILELDFLLESQNISWFLHWLWDDSNASQVSKETWLRCSTKQDSKQEYEFYNQWNRLDSPKPCTCQALQHSWCTNCCSQEECKNRCYRGGASDSAFTLQDSILTPNSIWIFHFSLNSWIWSFWSIWLLHCVSIILIVFIVFVVLQCLDCFDGFDLFDCFTVLPLFWSFRSIWLFDSALIFVNAWMSGCRLAICKQPAKLQWSHPWQPLNQLQRMSGRQGQPPQKILHLSLWYLISDMSGHTFFFKWNANDTSYYHALSCHISELAALVGIVNAGKHSKRASGCLTISCLAMIRMCLQPKTDQPFSLKTLQYIVLRSINHWHP